MLTFMKIIKQQTDKTKLVRFAVDCARLVVLPSEKEAHAALEAAEAWLNDPSENNRRVLFRLVLTTSLSRESSTIACSFAAMTAFSGQINDVVDYTYYTVDVVVNCLAGEWKWCVARFLELFPQTMGQFNVEDATYLVEKPISPFSLKRCPLCNALAECRGDVADDGDMESWSVWCTNTNVFTDGVSGHYDHCGIEGPTRATKEQAIAAWNQSAAEYQGD